MLLITVRSFVHTLSGTALLQLFVLRAESELQALSGDSFVQSLQNLDSLKAQLGNLYSGPILKLSPSMREATHSQQARDEIFRPRSYGNNRVVDIKYKGDWMKRPISDDEIAWLAKLLINLSDWLNERLRLNQVEYSQTGQSWSYVDVSGDPANVRGSTDAMKMVFCSILSSLIALGGSGMNFIRKHGIKVNLRVLASKKIMAVLVILVAFSMLKRAFA